MSKPSPYHLTSKASQGNAFTRHIYGEPSVFCTAKELGRAKAQMSLTLTERGQAAIAASNARLDKYIKPKAKGKTKPKAASRNWATAKEAAA